MATRKRTAKQATTKRRTNSNIQAAQRTSVEKRTERARASAETGKPAEAATAEKLKAAQQATDPKNALTKNTLEQNVKPGDKKPGTDQKPVVGMGEAANKIAGLASGIMQERQDLHSAQTIAANKANPNPLADASRYGANTNQARADRLADLKYVAQNKQAAQLKKGGTAVWMGYRQNRAKIRTSGPERIDSENGKDYTVQGVGDDVRSTDELMSWLSDETTFNQIRDAAKKAGMDVQSYDDVAKLWEQVVKQAAATFSSTGKKVTPWALLQLRGKTMVNGKPQRKTGVSTTVEEMDPAQAKVMLKNSLAQMLGRDPRQDEMDDFISKAQMIAKQNPLVQHYSQEVGFDGAPVQNSVEISSSKGGQDVVNAKAQLEAERLAENAPDYAQYQAAGVMMPWLNEALASPF